MIGANLLCFLLKLLDRSLVDTTALVDEMAGGSGLAGVNVADNHDVDVCLLLRHGCYCLVLEAKRKWYIPNDKLYLTRVIHQSAKTSPLHIFNSKLLDIEF